MTTQDQIKTARKMVEAFGEGNWQQMKDQLARDAVYEEFGTGRRVRGQDDIVRDFKEWKKVFPDGKGTVTRAVGSGDTAVLEIRWEGTHKGTLEAPAGKIPASGNRMKTPAALFASFEGNEIKEIHQYFDLMGLMKQLGATPEFAARN